MWMTSCHVFLQCLGVHRSSLEILQRQKRDWIIDSLEIDEGYNGSFPYSLGYVSINQHVRIICRRLVNIILKYGSTAAAVSCAFWLIADQARKWSQSFQLARSRCWARTHRFAVHQRGNWGDHCQLCRGLREVPGLEGMRKISAQCQKIIFLLFAFHSHYIYVFIPANIWGHVQRNQASGHSAGCWGAD